MNSVQDVPRKNAQAVEQALRQMQQTIDAQVQLVQKLQRSVSGMAAALTQVEQRINLMSAMSRGTGPTEQQ